MQTKINKKILLHLLLILLLTQARANMGINEREILLNNIWKPILGKEKDNYTKKWNIVNEEYISFKYDNFKIKEILEHNNFSQNYEYISNNKNSK